VLAALAHAAVLSEIPQVPASLLTARLEEVHLLSADIGKHVFWRGFSGSLFVNEGLSWKDLIISFFTLLLRRSYQDYYNTVELSS